MILTVYLTLQLRYTGMTFLLNIYFKITLMCFWLKFVSDGFLKDRLMKKYSNIELFLVFVNRNAILISLYKESNRADVLMLFIITA